MKKLSKFDPSIAAATSKAKELAEPAAKKAPVPEAHGLVQYNLRLDPDTRDRLRHAAHMYRISERELIARFAATLPPAPAKPPMPAWLKKADP